MRKKPWICGACRSMVTTRSAPATSIASAITRARIETRGSSFLSPFVTEIGHHGGHRGGARAAACVEPEEQLDDVVVRGVDRRLDDVDVTAADVLQQPDEDRPLAEVDGLGDRRLHAELGADRGAQPAAAGAAD